MKKKSKMLETTKLYLKQLASSPYAVIPHGETEKQQVFFSKLYDGDSIVFRLVYQTDLGFAAVTDNDDLFITESSLSNCMVDFVRQTVRGE